MVALTAERLIYDNESRRSRVGILLLFLSFIKKHEAGWENRVNEVTNALELGKLI